MKDNCPIFPHRKLIFEWRRGVVSFFFLFSLFLLRVVKKGRCAIHSSCHWVPQSHDRSHSLEEGATKKGEGGREEGEESSPTATPKLCQCLPSLLLPCHVCFLHFAPQYFPPERFDFRIFIRYFFFKRFLFLISDPFLSYLRFHTSVLVGWLWASWSHHLWAVVVHLQTA